MTTARRYREAARQEIAEFLKENQEDLKALKEKIIQSFPAKIVLPKKPEVIRFTHEQRSERRKEIAQFVKDTGSDFDSQRSAILAAAAKFKLSISSVKNACAEHEVKLYKKPEIIRTRKSRKMIKAENLLYNTNLSLKEISQKVGLSKERIRQIEMSLDSKEKPLPERREIDKALMSEQVFLDEFKISGDVFEARKKAKIGYSKARILLRESGLQDTVKGKSQKVPAYFFILADILENKLTTTEIANKHKVPQPRVSNIRGWAKLAGIPIPNRDSYPKPNEDSN